MSQVNRTRRKRHGGCNTTATSKFMKSNYLQHGWNAIIAANMSTCILELIIDCKETRRFNERYLDQNICVGSTLANTPASANSTAAPPE
jgi:hypothetical protein